MAERYYTGPIRRVRDRMPEHKKRHAIEMRNQPTPAEAALWQLIRCGRLGARFRRQSPLYGYIADFYAPSAMLVVEVDGSSHADRRASDAHRDAALLCHGIRTLRIRNGVVLHQPALAVNLIRRELRR